jgi:hypothetical protein
VPRLAEAVSASKKEVPASVKLVLPKNRNYLSYISLAEIGPNQPKMTLGAPEFMQLLHVRPGNTQKNSNKINDYWQVNLTETAGTHRSRAASRQSFTALSPVAGLGNEARDMLFGAPS